MKCTPYLGLAQAGHAEKALVVLNGHNTRNHRHLDSNLTAVVHELQVDIGIIEKLGDNDFCACITLITKKQKETALMKPLRFLKSKNYPIYCGNSEKPKYRTQFQCLNMIVYCAYNTFDSYTPFPSGMRDPSGKPLRLLSRIHQSPQGEPLQSIPEYLNYARRNVATDETYDCNNGDTAILLII